MISSFFEESIVKRAIEKKAVEIEIVSLRDFALDDYGTVDDRPYGGGAGMVIRADVASVAIRKAKKSFQSKVLLTSPKGVLFTQKKAHEYSKENHLIILAGHYEEFDERVRTEVDEEISLGDFVLTGGEIVAAAIVDSVVRLIPKVLKKDDATKEESFFTVSLGELAECVDDEIIHLLKGKNKKEVMLLEYPHYTRPEEFEGKKVPEVLLSGDPKKIRIWKIQAAFEETKKKRPDLLT